MKHTLLVIALFIASVAAEAQQCPTFPSPLYAALGYNLNCDPWKFEWAGSYFGDTINATIQWYRYGYGESKANAQPYNGKGSNTVSACYPATDEMGSSYRYFCRMTLSGCTTAESGDFYVSIGAGGDPCYTMTGHDFHIEADQTVHEPGSTITITAYTSAGGGIHHYTWYHNGEVVDTTNTHYKFIWGFGDSTDPIKLIIYNCTEADGGAYSITMQDGGECWLFTKPEHIHVGDVQCGTGEPSISTAHTSITTNDTAVIYLSGVNLIEGEKGEFVYTHQPEGSNPKIEQYMNNIWIFTTDMAGTYLIKYQITSSKYASCFRESTAISIAAVACGPEPTISINTYEAQPGETIYFTTTGLLPGETGTITYSTDFGTTWKTPYPASNTSMKLDSYSGGTYLFKYTITNSGAETCKREVISDPVVAYKCGTKADMSTDKPEMSLGETAKLIYTQTASGETAKLTCSKNGGTATDITGQTTFTPTEVGVYDFVYTIYKYGCGTNSGKLTIEVHESYSCGPEATIDVPGYIPVNNATTITVSAVGDYETGTLTCSKDGGAAFTIQPGTWTPTEVGEYELTWSVTHSKISCDRSAKITTTVFDCGDPAKITADKSLVHTGEAVTFTLSTPDAGFTGTVTYQKDGGKAVLFAGTVFKPTEAGEYTFTYVVENTLLGCQTQDQVMISVHNELVFDNQNGTNLWSDAKNWWPAYNRIPTYQDSAVLRQPCQVDITNAQTNDLSLEVTNGTALTVLPTGTLTVCGQLMNVKAGDILIRANASGNGALVLSDKNVSIPATVEFYALSKDREELNSTWQYMGYPLSDQPTFATAYPNADFYQWTNTPNSELGGNWQQMDAGKDAVEPFKGYCMTEEKEQVYTLKGILNDPVHKTINIPYNNMGDYPGFAFVANSWVAPIDIARLDESDFGTADATIYIMNTGTYAEAISEQGNISTTGMASARGQYNAIPVHAASYLTGALTTIPPMQGFFVHTSSATALQLDYQKSVFDAKNHQSTITPTRGPLRRATYTTEEPMVYHFHVSGFGAEDDIYILTSDAFSTQFDNGWDGYKATSTTSPVRMAIQGEEDELAVAAVPQLQGLVFNFKGGNHKTYTLRIACTDDGQEWIVWDQTQDTCTPVKNGAEYSFKCGAEAERFQIIRRSSGEAADAEIIEKFIHNDILYIRRGAQLYDALGRKIRK